MSEKALLLTMLPVIGVFVITLLIRYHSLLGAIQQRPIRSNLWSPITEACLIAEDIRLRTSASWPRASSYDDRLRRFLLGMPRNAAAG